MNKRLIALLLAVLLILPAGCKSKKNQNATEPAATVEPTEVMPTETLHPALADNPFEDENGNSIEEEAAAATDGATEPEETEEPTEPATEPSESATDPSEPEATEDDGEMTYEKYMSLSAAEQYAFMNSFESIDAFFEWFNAAKAAYEASRNEIEIGDGSFDLGELGG